MASLGRLVAGVAHEINNPVSFIASNVTPLRRRLSQAAARSPDAAQKALREAEEITDVMARGAERTAAIVKDLRTFSRLGEATRKPADLHEGIEVSLRLLAPRWRDRITVHRDFGDLPLVECDPGAAEPGVHERPRERLRRHRRQRATSGSRRARPTTA